MKLHSMNRKFICVLTATAMAFLISGCSIGSKKSVSSNPKDLDTLTFTSEGWSYDEEDDTYYQAFYYATSKVGNPDDAMTVYVPGEYLEAEEDDDTYAVSVAEEGRKNVYKAGDAPVVIVTGDEDIAPYMNEGTVFVRMPSKASAIDIEMAIRTIRYNAKEKSDIFPGCQDAYFLIGANTVALAGVTADDASSKDILVSYGSPMKYEDGEEISDNVMGVIIDGAASGNSIENAAKAFMYAYKGGNERVDVLEGANSYAEYINGLGLEGDGQEDLVLSENDAGNYLDGTYCDYLDYTLVQLYGSSEVAYEMPDSFEGASIDVPAKLSDPTEALYYLIGEKTKEEKDDTSIAPYWQIGMCKEEPGRFLCNMNLYLALTETENVAAGQLLYDVNTGISPEDITSWIRTCTANEREK